MSTIDELMEGKQPGEIRIRIASWNSSSWFQPYFRDRSGYWTGLCEDGDQTAINSKQRGWSLYEEPQGPWCPGSNDNYYYLLWDNYVKENTVSYSGFNFTRQLSKVGNCFRTREQAERYAKHRAARQRLELLALELNGEGYPLVPPVGAEAHHIYGSSNGLTVGAYMGVRVGVVYFRTRELAEKAIELTSNEDLIELFGVGKE